MRHRAGMAVIFAAAAFAFAPAVAEAARFCVQKPKCAKAGGTAQPTIQSALNAALANGPGRDRVELGPHTFTDGPFFAAAGNPVIVVGRGIGKTALTRIPTTSGVTILRLDDPASRIADLRVRINDGSTVEGLRTRGVAERVQVAGQSSDVGQTGVRLDEGGRLVRGRITLPPATGSYGVNLNGPGTVARASSVRANTGVIASSSTTGQPARAIRVRVIARETGINAIGGDVVVDQATVRMLGSANERGLFLFPLNGGNLTARHVTVVGGGGANGIGAGATLLALIGPCSTATLTLRNSILRGFSTDIERTVSGGGCSPGTPEANVDVAWSVYSPAKVVQSGDGELRRGKGNRNVNPRFRNQAKGDYRLRRRSPVIDRGQKGKPKAGESKVDIAGRKRVLDGDGNGKARRDIGAFERKALRRR